MFPDMLLFVLFLTELFSFIHGGQNMDHVMIERAVTHAMGFNSKNVPSGSPPVFDENIEGTRYMMQLYKNYRQGLSPKGLETNTVRSIQASIGTVNGEELFLFNMSAVAPTDRVLMADIHFFKRKMRLNKALPGIHMVYLEVAPTYISKLSQLDLQSPAYGWQANDASDAVRSCLAATREQPHLLAVRFVKLKSNKKGQLEEIKIPVRKFMYQHSKPFLVVYSNDTQNISLDHLDTYFHANEIEKRESTKLGKFKDNGKKVAEDNNAVDALHLLFKRSIFDNEVPQDPSEDLQTYHRGETGYNVPLTNPGVLKGREKPTREPENTSQYIPYPKKYRRRKKNRKSRRKGRRKNRGREELPPPNQWKSWVDSQNMSDDDEKAEVTSCGKKKLNLDFADIGWSDWIIAPKSFEANYCSGSCSFPLKSVQNPSNHATIQSIVHAVGLNRAVPEPCCVPDVLSSVTLLFMDENANVVLKNYPAMTVESCGCR